VQSAQIRGREPAGRGSLRLQASRLRPFGYNQSESRCRSN